MTTPSTTAEGFQWVPKVSQWNKPGNSTSMQDIVQTAECSEDSVENYTDCCLISGRCSLVSAIGINNK